MKRNELMKELKAMNVKFSATMKTEELEKLYNENIKESENKEMKKEEKKTISSFDSLKEVLERNNITVISENERRLTTKDVMYCKRANNKVRAYLKMKANDKLAVEKNTQYKANVLIDLNDAYVDYTIKRLYNR